MRKRPRWLTCCLNTGDSAWLYRKFESRMLRQALFHGGPQRTANIDFFLLITDA